MTDAYGKKPILFWIVLYLFVGAVAYGAIYYLYSYHASSSTASQTVSSVTSGNIYTTKTDPQKGSYLADFSGMSLYVFDKDSIGVSNCTGPCAAAWPPYTSGAVSQGSLPEGITVITRSDGSSQFAWHGRPLYYYAGDKVAGDVSGDGVGGTWHLAK